VVYGGAALGRERYRRGAVEVVFSGGDWYRGLARERRQEGTKMGVQEKLKKARVLRLVQRAQFWRLRWSVDFVEYTSKGFRNI
jgi:hypothetical protein